MLRYSAVADPIPCLASLWLPLPSPCSLRQELINLWHTAQLHKEEAAKGAPLTKIEQKRLRERLRCSGDYTKSTLSTPCVNGPPNIGYAY